MGFVHGGRVGIIPAYAGSTPGGFLMPFGVWDHPRIRGEHHESLDDGLPGTGSSPHTRGALSPTGGIRVVGGIIPAYAGSTNLPTAGDDKAADHPRIRGEHGRVVDIVQLVYGSSPHTRGALADCRAEIQEGRIIPAYAGSTFVSAVTEILMEDHPRIRGEHFFAVSSSPSVKGSSPHTRGAQDDLTPDQANKRIIPAYAGSTLPGDLQGDGGGDHPRIRGEHVCDGQDCELHVGSSPHTRGAPPHAPRRRRSLRIIPAYAGSTSSIASPTRSARDHPRIRGEHMRPWTSRDSRRGSSPHTRGAPPILLFSAALRRIIPAYAGSTRPGRAFLAA